MPPPIEAFAYPESWLRNGQLHAVLIDEAGLVCWAAPSPSHALLHGVAPGSYRLRWGYEGFRPREATLELREGETTRVVLEPF